MMLYPSAGSTSSTMYDPGFRPVQMAMPLEPVTFCQIMVPPVPEVPPR